tara:strand:- start:2040 stop:2261 length:222 start_codon:yes stop_codon:yes gene_type:complete
MEQAMTKIINLRTRRKQAARGAARGEGDRRAAQSGLSKADKALSAARVARARRELDGKRRDQPSDPETPPSDP